MMTGDETEYLQPVVGLQPTQLFKPLRSSWAGGLLLFLILLLEVGGGLMVVFWPQTRSGQPCEPLYFLLYCHSALWIIVLVLDHVLKWHHNKLRLDGYLTAFEQVTKYGSLPFYIVSLGTAVMLMITTTYLQRNAVLVCNRDWESPLIVSLVATSLETAALTYTLIVYLVKVGMFNQIQSPPDVTIPDSWEDFTNLEVGFRERGEDSQELLQKQADAIRYYRDTVEVLQRKVMGLTAQLRGDSIN